MEGDLVGRLTEGRSRAIAGLIVRCIGVSDTIYHPKHKP